MVTSPSGLRQASQSGLPLGQRSTLRWPRVLAHWHPTQSALTEFLRGSQQWSRQRILLPKRLRRSLAGLSLVQLAWSGVLVLIMTGVVSCGGPICTVATLDHHVTVLLLSSVCLIGFVGLTPLTRGLSKANSLEVLGLALTTTAGALALLGIAALVSAVMATGLVLMAFLTAFTFNT